MSLCSESNAHSHYQQALVEAKETDTVIIERSIGRPARVLKGPMTERIQQVEAELEQSNAPADERLQRMLPLILGTVNTRSALEGVLEEGFVWAGQVVGLINDVPTAKELIERTVIEAREITERMRKVF